MEYRNPIFLPPEYSENALFLLVQSPRVLYAYWELSPGLKDALNEEKKVQLRLNIEGRGPYYTCEIGLLKKSYYFSDVEPGLTYNCEIGIFHSGDDFYPLLRSNSITAPHDHPLDGRNAADDLTYSSFSLFNMSSWTLYHDKK